MPLTFKTSPFPILIHPLSAQVGKGFLCLIYNQPEYATQLIQRKFFCLQNHNRIISPEFFYHVKRYSFQSNNYDMNPFMYLLFCFPHIPLLQLTITITQCLIIHSFIQPAEIFFKTYIKHILKRTSVILQTLYQVPILPK